MTSKSVETQLLQEPIQQLDLSEYCMVTADTTVRETVERMRTLRQNCAFVVGGRTQLIGILTDRDVLKRVAANPDTWDQAVTTVMTASPDTLTPDATTSKAMRLMEQHRYRNVPVVASGARTTTPASVCV